MTETSTRTRRLLEDIDAEDDDLDGLENGVEIDRNEKSEDEKMFHQIDERIQTDDRCRVNVWHLWNYDKDHRERPAPDMCTYFGVFPYTKGDMDSLLDQIREAVKVGGVVRMQFTRNGDYLRNGIIRIAPWGSATSAAQTPQQPTVVVQPTAPASNGNGLEFLKGQFGFVKELVSFTRDLIPPPAPPPPPTGDDRPVEQRVLETAVGALLSNPKPTGEHMKLVELLSPKQDTGVWDFAVAAVQYAGPPFWNALSGLMNAVTQRLLTPQAAAGQTSVAGTVVAGSSPNASVPAAQIAGGAPDQAQAEAPQLTPADIAFRRTVARIVEDCMAGANDVAAAETVADLACRFPDFRPFIGNLVEAEAEEIIKLCAGMAPHPEIQNRIMAMTAMEDKLKWVEDLQERVKEVMPIRLAALEEGEAKGEEEQK